MIFQTLAFLQIGFFFTLNLWAAQPVYPQAHSHNDYYRLRPLQDALRAGFLSVEADIWLNDKNQIMVGHSQNENFGTLEDLYLKPLAARVASMGSVYGDGSTFHLWVDIKDKQKKLRPILKALLEKYPMLSRFSKNKTFLGPVTVILTGNPGAKKRFVEESSISHATRDSNAISEWDSRGRPKWGWYALNWKRKFFWNGVGKIPYAEKYRLQDLVAFIHKKNRKVRFYNTPETEAYYAEALTAGVDHIGTDHLDKLKNFLAAASAD